MAASAASRSVLVATSRLSASSRSHSDPSCRVACITVRCAAPSGPGTFHPLSSALATPSPPWLSKVRATLISISLSDPSSISASLRRISVLSSLFCVSTSACVVCWSSVSSPEISPAALSLSAAARAVSESYSKVLSSRDAWVDASFTSVSES